MERRNLSISIMLRCLSLLTHKKKLKTKKKPIPEKGIPPFFMFARLLKRKTANKKHEVEKKK